LERLVDRVVVVDPGGGLDHLGERPVRDPLAIGEAAAGQHDGALDSLDELACEAALADARLAVDRDEMDAAVAHGPRQRDPEQLELRLAADERSAQAR